MGFKRTYKFLFALVFNLLLLTSYSQTLPFTDDLQMWLVGDSVTVDGSNNVSNWKDQSGNGNDALQVDPTKQPIYYPDSLFGRGLISFDGVIQSLKTASFTLEQPYTVFMIFENTGGTSNNYILDGNALGTMQLTTGGLGQYAFSALSGFYISPNTIGSGFVLTNFQTKSDSTIFWEDGILDGPPQIVGSGNPNGFTIGTYANSNSSAALHGGLVCAEVIIYDTLLHDTNRVKVENYLMEKYSPSVSLGPDTVLNSFCPFNLTLSDDYFTYNWSTGETTNQLTTDSSGIYHVTTTGPFGRTTRDTISITFPSINQLTDTAICLGNSIIWNTNLDTTNFDFLWSNGSTDSLITITSPGQYWVTVTDTGGCFRNSDTITVTVDSLSATASLGPDITVCRGSSIGLISGATPGLTYLWNTGETSEQILIDTAGTYFVQVTNGNNCIANDTIVLDTNGIAPNVGFTSAFPCTNEMTLFVDTSNTSDGSNIISRNWDFGDGDTSTIQNPNHQYSSNTLFQVRLEITTDSGCVNSTIVPLQIYNPPIAGFSSLPNGKFVNETILFTDTSSSVDGSITSWMWDFGDILSSSDTSTAQNPSYIYTSGGNRNVQLITTTQHNCKDTVIQSLAIGSLPFIDDLKMWLVGDSVTIDGSNNVSSWKDQSGNGNDALQVDPTKQPTYHPDSLFGHGLVSFDGVIQSLKTASFTLEQPYNVYMVFENTGGASNNYILDGNALGTMQLTTGGSTQYAFTAGSGFYSSPNTIGTDFVLLNFEIEEDSATLWEDGVSDGPPQIVGPGDPNGFTIGTYANPNSSDALHGNLICAEVIVYDTLLQDTNRIKIENYLIEKYSPSVSLGPDTVLNSFCPFSLTLSDDYFTYNWSTGETTNQLTTDSSGIYNVTTTGPFSRTTSDTISITFPSINQLNDTTICLGDSIIWNTNLDTTNFDFIWSNGSTDSLTSINSPGKYWVTVTDLFACSKVSDTITVTIDSLSVKASLGPDITVCRGSSIGLVSGSSNDLTYVWNTGETTEQITIDTAGTYFVQVTNNNGCVANDTVVLDTNGIAPVVNFSSEDQCTNVATLFTDMSTTSDGSNIISRNWDFGDGNTSTNTNPSNSYTTNAVYQVRLEVTTDSGCVNNVVIPTQIYNPPVAGFFTTTDPICSRSSTSFSDNSFSTEGVITSYSWDFGDTGTSDTSSLQNPTYTFPITNNYSVSLTVTSEHNCVGNITNLVTVKASPNPSFTTSKECLDESTQFTNTSTGTIFSVSWDFGDGNTSFSNNPTNNYIDTGTYNVTLIVTELNGCLDTIITPVKIYDNPVANFDGVDFCAFSSNQLFDNSSTVSGTITEWEWNVVDHSNQSNEENPIFTFSLSDTGTYEVNLKVTTNFGCSDSISDTIHVRPLPNPNFSFNPTTGAPPLTVNFTNLSSDFNSYIWSFGDDSTSTDISPTHIYSDSGLYYIQLLATNSFGCSDSIMDSIFIINPILDIAITNVSYNFIPNTNFLTVFAQISNLGTTKISDLNVEAEISSIGTIRENWMGNLSGGSQTGFQFTSSFEIGNGDAPDVICVRASLIDGTIDDFPENNEFCVTASEFQLINMSPNPTIGIVNLEYIIPSSDNVTIDLYSSSGKKANELFSGPVEKGFIRQTIDLSNYRKGIYFVHVTYKGISIREKIILH